MKSVTYDSVTGRVHRAGRQVGVVYRSLTYAGEEFVYEEIVFNHDGILTCVPYDEPIADWIVSFYKHLP